MGKAKKSTKKFVKSHLRGELERRRKFKKDNKRFFEDLRRKRGKQQQQQSLQQQQQAGDNRNGDADAGGDSDDDGRDAGDDTGLQLDFHLKRRGMFSDAGGLGEEDEDSGGSDGGEDDDDPAAAGEDDDDVETLEDFDDLGDESDGEDGSDAFDEHSENDAADTADAAADPARQRRQRLRNEIAEHKKQMEEAMKRDPVFFKFLQENDADLLRFGDGEDGDDAEGDGSEAAEDLQSIMRGESSKEATASRKRGGQDDDDEDDEDEDDDDGGDDASDLEVVTRVMVDSWTRHLHETHSLRAAKKIILAFRTVVAEGETESDEQERLTYSLADKKVHNAVLLANVKYIIPLFEHHLGKSDKT
ncbi:Nucleolar Complex 2 protein, partial [Cladochytrium tenue]